MEDEDETGRRENPTTIVRRRENVKITRSITKLLCVSLQFFFGLWPMGLSHTLLLGNGNRTTSYLAHTIMSRLLKSFFILISLNKINGTGWEEWKIFIFLYISRLITIIIIYYIKINIYYKEIRIILLKFNFIKIYYYYISQYKMKFIF